LKRKGLMMIGLVIISTIALSIICPLGCAGIPPDPIIEKLNELKDFIADAVDTHPTLLTDTNTMQQANALYNKIDAVKMMVEQDNYLGATKKLEDDISPKLSIPPDPYRRSWLSDDPELQFVVEEFAGTCQSLIGEIIMLLTEPLA